MTPLEKKALRIHYFLIISLIVLAAGLVWEIGYESRRRAGGWMRTGMGDYGPLKKIDQDIDMLENEDAYIVICRIQQADKDNIEVFLADNYLAINVKAQDYNAGSKQRESYPQRKKEGARRHKILIPGPVRGKDIRAQYNNGILTITLPKKRPKDDLEPFEVQVI